VPDCDQIRCPKLDGVMKAVLPTDAIKADGYLSRLQLDAVAPLVAILERAEAGDLTPEKAVASTQVDGKRSSADGPRKMQKTVA